jgi:hypothetical protein
MKTKFVVLIMAGLMLSTAMVNVEAVQVRGGRSCGVWIKDKDNSNSLASTTNVTWLVGFLSGIAFALNKDFLRGTDNASLELWVDNYCRANPLHDSDDAGARLAIELIRKNGL